MKEYLSCAETAKLIRQCLKESFPGMKFSVKSHTYAGGASIDVGWLDGPNEKQVKAVIGIFEGSYFDGMIDYKGSYYHTLDGKSVSFGADYIFCRREYSLEVMNRTIERIRAKYRIEAHADASTYRNGDTWNIYIVSNHQNNAHWSLQSEINRERSKLSLYPNVKKSPTRDRVKCTGNDGYSRACGADVA